MRLALVGRQRELDILADAIDRAIGGFPCVVLCRGEPGIGKTRLAREVSDLARDRGVAATWGTGVDSHGAPPYWPWTQVLGGLDICEVSAVAAEHGLARDLVDLVPNLSGGTRDDGDAATEARFRQFDAMARLLCQLAAGARCRSCSTTRSGRTDRRCCCSATLPAPSPTSGSCCS